MWRRVSMLKLMFLGVMSIGVLSCVYLYANTVPREWWHIQVPISYKDDVALVIEQLRLPERSGCNQIPKRIHQTWNTESIPGSQAKYVETWMKYNPDWEYWFWTAKQMDEFVSRRFPKYIEMFRNYPKYMERADAMRFFVLYEFGGVYADLDVSALRPWDEQLTRAHTLLIPEDHEAHTVLLFGLESIAMSAIIMSTPGHQFFAHIIRNLPAVDKNTDEDDLLGKAGPLMVTRQLEKYKAARNASIGSICDAVYVPYHYDFNPDFDKTNVNLFRRTCRLRRSERKAFSLKKKICSHLISNGFTNHPKRKSAYTNHAFAHTYLKGFVDSTKRDIKKIAGDMFVNVTERYMKLVGPNPGGI
ncbi:uncharacterized protein LOC141898888 [Tubulanus polymorphus]|uniref:uncharacterized protein LOC141898888 n=1 Tax=Tubulanus polymorphus TaxID=672921 RepID=UPI003DA563B8